MKELFEKWGKEQRLLRSARNDELKKQVLSQYPSSEVEKPRPISRIPWLSLALASAAVVVLFVSALPAPRLLYKDMPASTGSGGFALPSPMESAPANDSLADKILRYPVFPNAPVTDTREFLKTNYYSTLRTRHVTELTGRVQTIVRGFGGRVDGASSSEKSGYVSFAVSADKFEMFRQEIKTLVGGKFYMEQTYSENLLPQKQSIEEQQAAAQKTLDQLKADREKLNSDHKRTISSLNAQLNSVLKERTAIPADDPRQTGLAAQENNLRARIANENRDYQNKLASLDAQIKNAEENLTYIQKQDQNLLDNVATVNGTISLQWISIWEMADLYLPGPLLAWLLALAALVAYIYNRRPLPILFS